MITYAQFAATAADAAAQKSGERIARATAAPNRALPSAARAASRIGAITHATAIESGCIANAPQTSPCSRSASARVEPHVGHGTPRNRFIGHRVRPNACASATHPATTATGRAHRPQRAARSRSRRRVTARESRREAHRRRERRRHTPPRTPPRPRSTRTASSRSRQCRRRSGQGSRPGSPETRP